MSQMRTPVKDTVSPLVFMALAIVAVYFLGVWAIQLATMTTCSEQNPCDWFVVNLLLAMYYGLGILVATIATIYCVNRRARGWRNWPVVLVAVVLIAAVFFISVASISAVLSPR